jgi:hypothetical protein
MQKGREKNSLGEICSRRHRRGGEQRRKPAKAAIGEGRGQSGGSPRKREAGQRTRLKPKRGGVIIPLGDLMREATRLSRICFISLISPRKKLAVVLSFGTIISYPSERLILIL